MRLSEILDDEDDFLEKKVVNMRVRNSSSRRLANEINSLVLKKMKTLLKKYEKFDEVDVFSSDPQEYDYNSGLPLLAEVTISSPNYDVSIEISTSDVESSALDAVRRDGFQDIMSSAAKLAEPLGAIGFKLRGDVIPFGDEYDFPVETGDGETDIDEYFIEWGQE